MDYRELLDHSYKVEKAEGAGSRLEYLCDMIFDIETSDDSMAELFGRKAVEVCVAVSTGETFKYIENQTNYIWYLVMMNLPFFKDKIEFGVSIRGAWWRFTSQHDRIRLNTCGLWDGKAQLVDPVFSTDEWEEFIVAVVSFSEVETPGHGLALLPL